MAVPIWSLRERGRFWLLDVTHRCTAAIFCSRGKYFATLHPFAENKDNIPGSLIWDFQRNYLLPFDSVDEAAERAYQELARRVESDMQPWLSRSRQLGDFKLVITSDGHVHAPGPDSSPLCLREVNISPARRKYLLSPDREEVLGKCNAITCQRCRVATFQRIKQEQGIDAARTAIRRKYSGKWDTAKLRAVRVVSSSRGTIWCWFFTDGARAYRTESSAIVIKAGVELGCLYPEPGPVEEFEGPDGVIDLTKLKEAVESEEGPLFRYSLLVEQYDVAFHKPPKELSGAALTNCFSDLAPYRSQDEVIAAAMMEWWLNSMD